MIYKQHIKTDWLKQQRNVLDLTKLVGIDMCLTKPFVKITNPSWVKFRTNLIGYTNKQPIVVNLTDILVKHISTNNILVTFTNPVWLSF